ncbi:hypothetical protein QKU48_gp0570 [Fadolivirus algeromassiliense]|jgi:hypothetical protein|uniref:Uncharacterized protein n=1 Tax=Fadolivirus FV1/VV64 TaxID=3070911 RepID=A0A7D3UPL9_9VIRU|nr:hypothetical protein QKU48_gp0570 [Fadolivirus algeromassiliense]QKF94028.1 hypothetical protein Fadolivirus_1_570 [Fadolivirus FV1/VV64]
MSNYTLINPCIEGNIANTFSGKSQLDAAVDAWNGISKYITNNVPRFAFTLENNETNKLHHFVVNEKTAGDGSASYKISELDLEMKPSDIKSFKNRINNFKKSKSSQDGGKKHKDDDDDSSSSSSEVFNVLKVYNYATRTVPIGYWWYDPLVYRLDSVYIPTFITPLTPYIEVATINYYPW